MAISNIGQLAFCTQEALYFQECAIANVGDGDDPVIAADPADADKKCMKFLVGGTTLGDLSRIRYSFSAGKDEVWVEFQVRCDTSGNDGSSALRAFHMLDSGGAAITRFTLVNRQAGFEDTRYGIAASPVSFSSLDMGEDAWVRVRLRYVKGTGANAIYQAWVHSAGDWVLVVDVSNGASTAQIVTLEFCSEPVAGLATAAGNKILYYRNFAWDAVATSTATYTGWKDGKGLDFGHACSASSNTSIDVKLRYQPMWRGHLYSFPGTAFADMTSPVAQFQVSPSGAGTWSNIGSPVALAAGTDDDCIVRATATGLSPLTAYDFRVLVTHDSGTAVVTSDTATLTTKSAANGTPASSLVICWSSCEHQGNTGFTANPKTGYDSVLAEAPHAFFHLGDNIYADDPFAGDQTYGDTTTEAHFREKYRGNLYHDYNRRRVHTACAILTQWDDHECNVDNAVASDITAECDNAADDYISDRRLNAFTNGRGFWLDTARCRFICPDLRGFRDLTGTDTLFGAAQLLEVKAKLTNTGKPLNFLMMPGPSVQDHGASGGADGPCLSADTRAERDDLFAHFHANNPIGHILIICCGDRHFVYEATDWAADYGGRVKSEFCASPMSIPQRDPDSATVGLVAAGNTTINFLDTDAAGAVISRYGMLRINEQTLTVITTLHDGADGAVLHSSGVYHAYSADAPYRSGSVHGSPNRMRGTRIKAYRNLV